MPTIDEVVASLKADLGDRIVSKGSDLRIDAVSTGSLAVDLATGFGGFPRGFITELYGNEAGGKTTLALTSCIRNAMDGGFSVFMDAENKTYPGRPVELGMDPDRFYILQPKTKVDTLKTMEDVLMKLAGVDGGMMVMFRPYTGTLAWDVIRMLLEENLSDIIAVDSVHALATGAEKDSSAADQHMGILARLMSQQIKNCVSDLGLTDTALVFVNQIREKIGVMYGNPNTTPSGRALKFYASLRMKVRMKTLLKERGRGEYGIRVIADMKKNSLAKPRQTAEFDIDWDCGIVEAADVLNAAKDAGIVSTGGGYYKFGEDPIAGYDEDGTMIRGYDHAVQALKENPELMAEIREAVLNPPVVDEETGEIL